MKKYYIIRVKCTNCGHIQDLNVPKGETKEQFLKDGECENCGCIGVLNLRANEKKEEKEKGKSKGTILWK